MKTQSCKICNSKLEIEQRCKFCEEPTRLFCHTCGVITEKIMHPACLVLDVNSMVVKIFRQKI